MNSRDQRDQRRAERIREKVFAIVRDRTFTESAGIGQGRLQSWTVYPDSEVREALHNLRAEGLICRKELPEGASYWRLSGRLLQAMRRRRLLQALAEAVGRPMTTETRRSDA
jgi:hypothetical protein